MQGSSQRWRSPSAWAVPPGINKPMHTCATHGMTMVVRKMVTCRHRIWPDKGSTVQSLNGNDPRPTPGKSKTTSASTPIKQCTNKGMQGVQARYGAELPPFISIVQYPGRPVILGMEHGDVVTSVKWCLTGCPRQGCTPDELYDSDPDHTDLNSQIRLARSFPQFREGRKVPTKICSSKRPPKLEPTGRSVRPNLVRAELKVTDLRWRSPICGFPAVFSVFCENLRFSAVSLCPPNARISRRRGESVRKGFALSWSSLLTEFSAHKKVHCEASWIQIAAIFNRKTRSTKMRTAQRSTTEGHPCLPVVLAIGEKIESCQDRFSHWKNL